MDIRERTENLEYEILAPYAAKSRECHRRQTLTACPLRTDFQRDRDRILHSKAFRRLKHKTQVYIIAGDHYRTRMTHSLEVAQIARTIARALRLNEDLTEAIALGHDVGHTPFGHAGEAAMAHLLGHFAHNEQSLRVVDYIERNGEGLKLTDEVRDGIVNHTGGQRPKTLEGRIVHIADRIAYLCHDYDDSCRAGVLAASDLPATVQENMGIEPSAMITTMVTDLVQCSQGQNDILMSEEMEKLMKVFRDFMFKKIYHSQHLLKERAQAAFVLQELYGYFMANVQSLPDDFCSREKRWGRQQIVADYVAGLTDSYAVALFKDIFMPPVGFSL